jgi:hypothetical protein
LGRARDHAHAPRLEANDDGDVIMTDAKKILKELKSSVETLAPVRSNPAKSEKDKMMNEIAKGETSARELDGFDGYASTGEDRGGAPSERPIQGDLLKFTNEGRWVDPAGGELSSELELVAVNVGKSLVKWKAEGAPESRLLGPGEKFPDIAELNASTPQSEWITGPDGALRGPWQAQRLLYLLNPSLMGIYTWPTSTIGGSIAIRELVDRTNWMRRYRGANAYAVVSLGNTPMKTKFGTRARPHLEIRRWTALGGDGQTALSGPRTVEEPSLSEEMGDAIPF